MTGEMWNLWHGCHKKSEGCQHCYVFRRDAEFEKDSNFVTKTSCFNLPVRRDRSGNWKVPSGTLMWTCFTSDFFIEEADDWREDAWLMIRRRSDLHFYMVTKRPERIIQCLPEDWGEGYENVTICCTMENQRRVDERLPLFRELPIRHKAIICEPLLESIDFRDGLGSWAEQVTVGGESGSEARVCDYEWVLDIRRQCIAANVPFYFKQTGALFRKDGRLYNIPRSQQMQQARKAAIDYRQVDFKKMETKQKTSRTPHSRLFHVILKFLDHFCRDSANERVVWNVLGDDGTGCHYHIVPNLRRLRC